MIRAEAPEAEQEGGNGSAEELIGMKKWVHNYLSSLTTVDALQQQADDYMRQYDSEKQRADEERAERAAREAEEDGWTLVTGSKGRKKSSDPETGVAVGAVAPAVAAKAKEKQEKKREEEQQGEGGVSFYRFQKKEQKRNELLDLQKKFMEDKKKIASMKEKRKFRPY